jgi:hypothetical protein
VLKRTLLTGLSVAALLAPACGGDIDDSRPRSSDGGMVGEARNTAGSESGDTAGTSSGRGGHGPGVAGAAASMAGAGRLAGAGAETAAAAGGGQGGAAGESGQESNGTSGAGAVGGPAGGASSTTGAAGESTMAGAGGVSSTAAGGEGAVGGPVSLTPVDGWIDGNSNVLSIQGAVFAYADDLSRTGLIESFTGSNACISGTAARVDLQCTPAPPATDCYGSSWGAAIGLNLNQPIDPDSGLGEAPVPYDASALSGFGFELSGSAVPVSLRFKVENAAGEYCNPPAKPVKLGNNVFLFSDLIAQCWKPGGASAVGAKASLIRLAWQVVTNTQAQVPFDFCVSNVRALR